MQHADRANGTLTLGAVTGGVAPYTYSVDGSAFTATTVYNNLAAGNHTVAVTDANGCVFNAPDAIINNTGAGLQRLLLLQQMQAADRAMVRSLLVP